MSFKERLENLNQFLVDATYTAAAKQHRQAFSGSGIGRQITGRFVFWDSSIES